MGKKGDVVVFGGTSAGGAAAMNHIDSVAAKLKQHNVKVLGLFDAPMYFEMDTFNPQNQKVIGLHERFKIAFNNYNEKTIVPPDCAKDFDADN